MPQAATDKPRHFCPIDFARERQFHAAGNHIEVVGERVADDFGLLVDFLGHEVAVVALVDERCTSRDTCRTPLDGVVVAVKERNAPASQHTPVTFLEIGDQIGEGCQRQRIRPKIHLAIAKTDGERRAPVWPQSRDRPRRRRGKRARTHRADAAAPP